MPDEEKVHPDVAAALTPEQEKEVEEAMNSPAGRAISEALDLGVRLAPIDEVLEKVSFPIMKTPGSVFKDLMVDRADVTRLNSAGEMRANRVLHMFDEFIQAVEKLQPLDLTTLEALEDCHRELQDQIALRAENQKQ